MPFIIPFGVKVAGSDPIDYDRYIRQDIAGRDALIGSGTEYNGLQVYVLDEQKLYILIDKTLGTWEEVGSGGGGESLYAAHNTTNIVVAAALPTIVGISTNSVVSGGDSHTLNTATYGVIGGGQFSTISGEWQTIGGGIGNIIEGGSSHTISGGAANTIFLTAASNSIISGGSFNGVRSGNSTIVGGLNNSVGTDSVLSTIVGGEYNSIKGHTSAILSGFYNDISAIRASILGGEQNRVLGDFGAVLGGLYNTAHDHFEIVGGRYNVEGVGSTTTWIETDRLVSFGNGTSDLLRSDAFVLLKNGLLTLPSVTNALIDADDKAVVTKEYLVEKLDGVAYVGVSNNFTEDQVITGDLLVTGSSSTFDVIGTSDITLKENIASIKSEPINSVYKTFNFIGREEKRVGVIAQELEITNPEFVRTLPDGIKAVSYIDLHCAEIALLKSEITGLKEQLKTIMDKLDI